MLQDERRDLHERYIRTAMATQNRDQRTVTFSWPADDGTGQPSHDVVIDGRTLGALNLGVRSNALTEQQAEVLRGAGFRKQLDDDRPSATVYARQVHSASVADALTFVDWAYLCVLGAPDGYEAGIRTAGGKGKADQSGCLSSCRQMIQFALLIFLIGGVIAALLW